MPNRCVAICPNIASNEGKRETIPIQHCCELPDSGYSVTVKSTLFQEKPMLQSHRLTGISCLLLICWHLLASSSYAQILTRLEPTTQQRAVFENYEELLNTYQLRMSDILNGDVAELNRNLEALGLAGILHPKQNE